MTLRAVILNDTSSRYHHGCSRVMRLLVAGLERHGLTITARSPARHDWAGDDGLLSAMRAADVIVVNGEGTLHHGRPAGARLLAVAQHAARADTPLALVNALWQDNPEEWSKPLAKFDLIAARDNVSAEDMAHTTRAEVRWLPDLSLSAPAEITPGPRRGVIIGDSVKPGPRRVLGRAARRYRDARLVPTKTLGGRLWRFAPTRAALAAAWCGGLGLPPLDMPGDEAAYLDRISRADLHITGRFHAVCLSMLTETPFLALGSNASKIERLLADAGLGQARLLGAEALAHPPEAAPFSTGELDAIRSFRERAQRQAEALFADIAALARREP